MIANITRSILLFFILLLAHEGNAQGEYDLRFFIYEVDVANSRLLVDVEVRANTLATEFNLSDMNFRFSIGRGLANPLIEEELTLSGFTSTTNPPTNSIYEAHTLTGSSDTVVSYNIVIGGGDGYPVNHLEYVKIGRLSFDIIDMSGCLLMAFHTHSPDDFPPTFVGELINSTVYATATEGAYNDYVQCDIPTFNHSPSLMPDVATTEAETPVSICVLDNDFDTDSDLDLSTMVITNPPPSSQGTISFNTTTNCIDFTPAAGFSGIVDQIVYKICDDGYNIPATSGGDNATPPSVPVPAAETVQVHGSECSTATLSIEVVDSRINLDVSVFLQGPYVAASGIMRTDLNTNALVPVTEPYTAMGMHTGSEMTTAAVLAATPVVDWVLVELRDKTDISRVLESKAGLLLQNGTIKDVDGVSSLVFASPFDNYFIAVRHRTHIGVVSKNPFNLGVGNTVVDFTTMPLYGTGSTTSTNGYNVLWCADANVDHVIDAADRSETWNNRNQTGYVLADVDLNGIVDAADRSHAWNNRNKGEQLQ